jgi:hypothetical protein
MKLRWVDICETVGRFRYGAPDLARSLGKRFPSSDSFSPAGYTLHPQGDALKQLHCVSYAKNRTDHCRREGAGSYVRLHNAGDDRQI